MARPYTSRRNTRRPQVSIAPEARPQLDVVAPLDVRVPVKSSPLDGLTQALGMGLSVAAANRKARDERSLAEGIADEQIGEADVDRAATDRAYARGAFETAILEQYQNAERSVAERAATELDRSLPDEDQVRIVDGWMKSELGPLVSDPRAKVLFAKRYQSFIDTTAANIQKEQLEANAKAAVDTLSTDMATAIDRGTFTPADWDETFHRLVSQTGDPVGTRNTMVGVVGQAMLNAAARGEDYRDYINLIPTSVTGPDGAKLPSPLKSPAVRGRMIQYEQQAKRAFDEFHKNQYAGAYLDASIALDDMIGQGQLVTKDTFAANGWTIGEEASNTFTPAQALSFMRKSEVVRAKMAAKQATYNSYMAAYRRTGRLASILYAPGGPDSPEKRADFADSIYQQSLVARGVAPEELAGPALIANGAAVQTIAQLSAQEGVPYRPLKNELNSINPSAPGDVSARLPVYNLLKRQNLLGMYVDDESALVYEVANGAAAAGADEEGVRQAVRDMADKDTSMYVKANSGDLAKRAKNGIELKTGNLVLDRVVNSNNTGNPAYVNGLYRSLALKGLSSQMRPDAADKFARERIQATHTALDAGGTFFVVPNDAIPDVSDAEGALDWYNSRLPELAKTWGIPEDEGVVIKATIVHGRRPMFQVYRADGAVPISQTEFTLPGVINAWKRTGLNVTGQEAAAQTQKELEEQRQFSETLNTYRF